MNRRLGFCASALVTIMLGLLVHLRGSALTPDVRDILGDALWAAMIASWAGALFPDVSLGRRVALAYGWCALTEISQLYHTPAIDAIRASRLGHLVLGSGFDSRDLASYAAGIAAAAGIEWLVTRARATPRLSHSPRSTS